MFDILHAAVRALLLLDAPGVGLVRTICAPPLTPLRRPTVMRRLLPAYLAALRRFRCRCFTRWLELMQAGSAVVHLPSFFKAYSGRVFEGMAAGRPVISWDIPNRPLNRALFRDGEEILLFDPNSPNHLASQIRRISSDPALAVRIAENARMKLERSHTVETRVRQLLRWIASGEQPGYLSQA
jgi:glycosyltransferase involved in cell wall biosynthesis